MSYSQEPTMKIVCRLLVLLLPVFAGCTAFENQCNEFTEVDDQLACLDTAFLSLESELVRTRGERTGEREATDLREYLEYCDDLRERASDDEWREQNEDDFEERLRECMAVWERLGDDRERQECERDEEAWGKEDLRPEYVEVRLDVDTTEESREEACPRGELGELRTIRDRTRGAVQRGEDSDERGDRLREGLREGRRWVDRLLGRTGREDLLRERDRARLR